MKIKKVKKLLKQRNRFLKQNQNLYPPHKIFPKNTETPNEEQCDEHCDHQTNDEPVFMMPNQNTNRVIGLYGDIDEEKCSGVIAGLYSLKESGRFFVPVDETEPEGEQIELFEPIEFVIKTGGGAVSDAFAVFDIMRMFQKDGIDIHTLGLATVMSAGVLLLAGGTIGERKVSKNCRLMLHSVSGGQYGHIFDLENQMKEAHWYQKRYIDELVRLTNGKLDKNKIREIFNNKIDFYFDAKKCIEFGLADKIV